MKLFIKLSFTAVAIVLFFNAIAVTQTNAQGPIPEILKRLEKNNESLKSLQANVRMTKYNSQLDELEEDLSGTVIYLPETKDRGKYMRINWKTPVREELAVIDDEYTLYRPTLKQAILGKVNNAKNSASSTNALSFMSMSKSELKDNYSIKYIGEENVKNGPAAWHLVLTPKQTGKYKSAELWVDKDGMPIQAKVIENNFTTTVLLSGIKKNVTIKASVFEIKYPKGTKEIKG